MPTLFRFLFVCGIIVATAYGIILGLVFFVEPRERDVTIKIPSELVNPPQQ